MIFFYGNYQITYWYKGNDIKFDVTNVLSKKRYVGKNTTSLKACKNLNIQPDPKIILSLSNRDFVLRDFDKFIIISFFLNPSIRVEIKCSPKKNIKQSFWYFVKCIVDLT